MHTIQLEQGRYFDSVHLMRVTREVESIDGVRRALVAMATDANRELAASLGFTLPDEATADRLLIAIDHDETLSDDELIGRAREIMQRRPAGESDEAVRPRTIDGALREVPHARLGLVSVAGQYAAREAEMLLDRGLHVMIFSDNVPLEEERRLKARAAALGLLVMGPDCGTALVNGVPLAFANAVRRGSIGIVAASGTGLQEVSCRIHANGHGVSQAIGTGGRDLRVAEAYTMRQGLAALDADPDSAVIVVVSKPPSPAARATVLAALHGVSKPVVLHFVGGVPTDMALPAGVTVASTLATTADLATTLAAGSTADSRPADVGSSESPRAATVRQAAAGLAAGRVHLRGLYCGGTLADEAIVIAADALGPVASVEETAWGPALESPHQSAGHTVVDLGEDVFTAGRPHPMIDPTIRLERIAAEAADPSTAVILLDFVLGSGAHEDPVGATVDTIRSATGPGGPVWIATIVGTDEDPQDLAASRALLENVGVHVADSNAEAARLAVAAVEAAGGGALWKTHRHRSVDSDAGGHAAPDGSATPGQAGAPLPVPLRPLFGDSLAVINIGLSGFASDLRRAGATVVDIDWRPPARGNQAVAALLKKLGR